MAQEDIKKEKKSFDVAQDELKALQLKCEEYLNGWKRERADFLNYKKEESERIGTMIKYANEELIFKIIPILDNFNLAATHIQDQGFLQIKKQLEDLLSKEGIETIEVLGKPFDPNTMEIVGESESSGVPDSAETETVAEEVQKGYTLNGKIIRVARVKITK